MIRKWFAIAVLLLGMTPALAQYRHVSLEDGSRSLPKKILILPADVLVHELSAGGLIEKVPEWTKVSSDNLTQAMIEFGKSSSEFTLIDLPPLSADEQEKMDQAISTFMTVGVTAHHLLRQGGDAWAHKRKEFDYTLGPGLAFLKRKTGADAAIIMAANDIVSSGGRKAAFIIAAAFGVALQTGRSVALSSMVDLDSGNLLWMHYDQSFAKDLKDYASAKEMVTEIMSKYPGGQ